jgi:hypothetical protein
MRIALMIAATLTAAAAANAASAASVEVKDAVARVTVVPENRSDIKVEIVSANPRLPLEVRTSAGRTIVDGRLNHRLRDCRGSGENTRVVVRDLGDVAWRDMPQIVIRTPRDVDIDTGGAVWGTVGRSASLKLGNAGCGDWTVANVEGVMRISQAGSGDTRTGSAGDTKLRIAGSGDTAVGDIHGPLDIDIAGSGDVAVASIAGPLDIHIAGSGDVKIAGGRATTMSVMVAGAKQVTGTISKTIMGSGGVTIGN